VSPNLTLDSVADSNYRGKWDVGGFLIFEWTLDFLQLTRKCLADISFKSHYVDCYCGESFYLNRLVPHVIVPENKKKCPCKDKDLRDHSIVILV
jgi:hypothetical protein